ncbi:MAG TPA: fimbria/pilus outer membrane usher protein [Rickettsia endosymbiont of Omalisus fontisbellaquei]|nr:fimbria/pilus outer membrane usher protein [Rickettsia endosymbiont of Omalisus fontisbellaquei]
MSFLNKIISVFIGIILFIPLSFADEITSDSELIVSLKVNYTETDIFPTIVQNAQGHYLIPLEDIDHFNVQEDYLKQAIVNYHDTDYINLDLLEGTKYDLNFENLDLNITFPTEKMQPQSFDASGSPMKNVDTKLISGAYLNYDITLSQNDDNNYLAGVEGLNYFTENGVYSYSFLFQTEAVKSNFSRIKNTTKNQNKFTRLETNWTYEDVNKMTNWRVGDSVTKPASWSNSSRFAGIQYATNFAVRPNLVTYPLLDFRGKSELPSSIEIFSNSMPIYNAKARTGDFDVSNIPVITGRGDLIVRTQDITGKIETITIPYYASPSLLRPGLSNFSYEAGFQRQNFTIDSNDYKYLVLNTDYMLGMTDYLTSGGHFEFLKSDGAVGVTNNLKIGNFGVIGISLASNIKNFGRSQRINCGYTYESEYFDINSNLDWNNKNYRDVYIYPNKTSSNLNYQVSASYGDADLGNLSINFLSLAVNRFMQNGKRSNILSTTYQKNITKKGFLSFTIGTDLKNRNRGNFAYMSFNLNLDGNKNVSFIDSYQNKYHTKQIGISVPITSNMGWGYNANLIKAKATNYNVQVNRNGKNNDIGLYLQKNDGGNVNQVNIKGGIVAIDKNYYTTRPITGSLALIKVNSLKNVGVYNNNLLAGYTNDQGKVLIPNVTPYVPSEIRLDDENLPLNTEFEDIALKVAPKTKSAVLLDFNVRMIKSVEMTIFDSNKHFIPFDSTVTIEGLEEELFIGYEGKIYINNIKDLEVLNGSICDENEENNKCCHFSIPVNKDLNDPVIDLGEVICK